MSEIPVLVKDLTLILIVAGFVTLIFKRLKQPLVLGYIVAGFLVSPHMPYTMSVVNQNDVQTWANIGVMFTLFDVRNACGALLRMEQDELHLPRRHARHEFHHHHLQDV